MLFFSASKNIICKHHELFYTHLFRTALLPLIYVLVKALTDLHKMTDYSLKMNILNEY